MRSPGAAVKPPRGREIHQVLDYLRAGARRFGSTRTGQFVAAYQDLPGDERALFDEYLPIEIQDD
jgi:hypothetical protein